MERIMDLAREKIEELRKENKILKKEKNEFEQDTQEKLLCRKFTGSLKGCHKNLE